MSTEVEVLQCHCPIVIFLRCHIKDHLSIAPSYNYLVLLLRPHNTPLQMVSQIMFCVLVLSLYRPKMHHIVFSSCSSILINKKLSYRSLIVVHILTMPPSKDVTAKVDAQSTIAKYVHSISISEWEKEKERYEEEEPLAKSKSWDEFLRLAISSQCLEGRSANAKAEIREGSQVLSKTRLKPNGLMGFAKRKEPEMDLAIANLERRARRYADKHPHGAKISRHGHDDARDRGCSQGHTPGHRRSHHDRVEEDVLHGRGKPCRTIVMESHHLRCHQTNEEDAEPRHGRQLSLAAQPTRRPHMPSINEEEVHRTPRQGSSYGPALPQEYVIPPPPPIVITLPSPSSESRPQGYPPPHQQSVRGSATLIGSGYSSHPTDDLYLGRYGAQSGRDSMADGGSRAGSQGRRSGVSHESTRSGRSAYTNDERRDLEATVACLTEEAVAVRVGVVQATGHLEADWDLEATVACLTGEVVAMREGVIQATGHLEADWDPEATVACLIGEVVAVRIGVI